MPREAKSLTMPQENRRIDFNTNAFDLNIMLATKWHNMNNRGCNPRKTAN